MILRVAVDEVKSMRISLLNLSSGFLPTYSFLVSFVQHLLSLGSAHLFCFLLSQPFSIFQVSFPFPVPGGKAAMATVRTLPSTCETRRWQTMWQGSNLPHLSSNHKTHTRTCPHRTAAHSSAWSQSLRLLLLAVSQHGTSFISDGRQRRAVSVTFRQQMFSQ